MDAPLPPCPAALVAPDGAPVLGAFAGAHAAVDLAPLAAPGVAGRLRHLLRAKTWVWATAISEEILVAVAIVEAGLFAGGFAWGIDRKHGAVVFEASAAGLPGLTGRVASCACGAARLTGGGLGAEIGPVGPGLGLGLRAKGRGFSLDAVLSPADAPAPFTLVAPVPGGRVRATTKAAGLAARGGVVVGERSYGLDGGTGGFDFTAGVLARDTSWRWAFATGRVDGAPAGFNLCEGFGLAAGDPGENAGFAVGRTFRLPAVVFQVGGPKAPWRISGPGVELTFLPQGFHGEKRNLGLAATRFVQVAGTFEGRIPGPDGGEVRIAGLAGVVEDHWARW